MTAEKVKKAVKKVAKRPRRKAAPAPIAPAVPVAMPVNPVPSEYRYPPVPEQKEADPEQLRVVAMGEDILSGHKQSLLDAVDMFAVSMRSGRPLPLQWLVDTLTTGEVKDVEAYL